MEYTINKLSKLAGISTRTLRYYDEINLISPSYISDSGYRMYTEKEVDLLQQILFYKTLGFELKEIKEIIQNPSFDKKKALLEHLENLRKKEKQISTLIKTVEKTIKKEEGEIKMSSNEKFKGFKEDLISKNEKEYGREIRKRYGNDAVDSSNKKMMNLTEKEYKEMEDISNLITEKLSEAIENNLSASSNIGEEIANLHKEWLLFNWNKNTYSKQSHRGLADMYIADERFTSYYDDKSGKGAAKFLRDAIYNITK